MIFRRSPRLVVGTYGPFYFRRHVGLTPEELRQHGHVIGASGTGKSRFLAGFYLALLRLGMPATLIDPHGTTAQLVLRHLIAAGTFARPEAYERILYLDLPAALRQRRYLPYNVLAQDERADVLASQVKDAFHRAWPELAQGAATFDTLLPDAVQLLIHHQLPLTELQRLLIDDHFRARLLAHETDADLAVSFQHVYNQLRKADQVQYAGSVLRRARQLTQLAVLKYGLAQPDLVLDFQRILANRQAVIVNLALKSDDALRLLGCLLTVGAEHAALARADLPPGTRFATHHLIIDEFGMFVAQSGEALSRMLSHTRKFAVFAVMAHQDWEQTPPRLRGAMSNVGFELTFALEREDAEYTSRRVGRVDTDQVKHTVDDEQAVERTHPLFYGLPEQWERLIQSIQDLRSKQAYLAVKNRDRKYFGLWPAPILRVVKLKTVPVPDIAVDREELARVEARYLARYFRPQEEVERRLAALRTAEPPPTRARTERVHR